MTTGERLVDISTLTTGTALEHFLNISTGSGGVCSGVELEVMMLDPDVIEVSEADIISVEREEEIITVKVVQRETKIIKE